jgi:hypothetical protein
MPPRACSQGPFATWRSVVVTAAEAERLATRLRYLDRFARSQTGAQAFEDGLSDNWEVVADVTDD